MNPVKQAQLFQGLKEAFGIADILNAAFAIHIELTSHITRRCMPAKKKRGTIHVSPALMPGVKQMRKTTKRLGWKTPLLGSSP